VAWPSQTREGGGRRVHDEKKGAGGAGAGGGGVTARHNRETRVRMSLREAVVTGRQHLLIMGGTGNVARSRAFLVTGSPDSPRVADTAINDASYRRHRGAADGRQGLSHSHGDGGGAPVPRKRCTANSMATKRQSPMGAPRRRH